MEVKIALNTYLSDVSFYQDCQLSMDDRIAYSEAPLHGRPGDQHTLQQLNLLSSWILISFLSHTYFGKTFSLLPSVHSAMVELPLCDYGYKV